MLKHDLSDLFVNDGGNPIKPSEKLCDLGVKLDQTLSFDGHISAIVSQLTFLSGILPGSEIYYRSILARPSFIR